MDESLNPVMIDPRGIRNMFTWVFLKCVRENASGGMATKGISNPVNWLTAGDTVHPGPARKYYIHPLHLVLLDSTVWRLILFEKYSTENEILQSPHLGVSSNPPASCQAHGQFYQPSKMDSLMSDLGRCSISISLIPKKSC